MKQENESNSQAKEKDFVVLDMATKKIFAKYKD